MSARDTAIEYRSRGWAPIPIPWRDKNPGYVGWQHLRVTPETLGAHFNGVRQNIGVLLGEPSSWLVDIDLDCPEALVVALDQLTRGVGAAREQGVGACGSQLDEHRALVTV